MAKEDNKKDDEKDAGYGQVCFKRRFQNAFYEQINLNQHLV